MSVAHFRVYGANFDGAHEATVSIDRELGLFTVRPLRRKRTYELPFSAVAEIVLWRVLKAELAQKKREKAARRRGR